MKRIIALIIITAACVCACSSGKWIRTSVAKEYNLIVTLEQGQSQGASIPEKYQQPCNIDLNALKRFMGELTYTEKAGMLSENKPSPIFQSDEIDRLAPVLVKTLAIADASQRLRFLSFNQGPSLLFTESRKSEGVVFVDSAGRLNMALNYINTKRLPMESSAIYSKYSDVDPLNIQTSDTTISATAPYVELHTFASGQSAPMWVLADLEHLEKSSSVGAAPNLKAADRVPPAVAPATEGTRIPVERVAPSPPATDTALKQETKSKLRYLKELYDEGLISEKDYEAKKKALLEKI